MKPTFRSHQAEAQGEATAVLDRPDAGDVLDSLRQPDVRIVVDPEVLSQIVEALPEDDD